MNRQQVASELVKVAKLVEGADTFKCPECGTKVLEQTGYCVKCQKKVKKAGRARKGWSEETLQGIAGSVVAIGKKLVLQGTYAKNTGRYERLSSVLDEAGRDCRDLSKELDEETVKI